MTEKLELSINSNDYTSDWGSITIAERMNDSTRVDIEMSQDNANVTADININKVVRIIWDVDGADTTIFQGRIAGLDYDSDDLAKFQCIDDVSYLLRGWNTGNYNVSGTAVNTITNALCSENLNGSSPWIVQPNTNDVTTSIAFRAQNMNRLVALQRLTERVNADWWPSWDGSNNPRFNISATRGSGVSQATFYTHGANQNVSNVTRKRDIDKLWNFIYVLGYGDGTVQIISDGSHSNAASISAYGRREYRYTDRTITTQTEANRLAANILTNHKDPINRFILEIEDIETILPDHVEVGDTVTIDDDNVYFGAESQDYVVMERKLIFSGGNYKVVLECASKSVSFVEELTTIAQHTREMALYAQIKDPGHIHPGSYSVANHTHTEYAPINHQHGEKIPANHQHGEKIPANHQHGEKIPKTHIHTYNAPTTHTHGVAGNVTGAGGAASSSSENTDLNEDSIGQTWGDIWTIDGTGWPNHTQLFMVDLSMRQPGAYYTPTRWARVRLEFWKSAGDKYYYPNESGMNVFLPDANTQVWEDHIKLVGTNDAYGYQIRVQGYWVEWGAGQYEKFRGWGCYQEVALHVHSVDITSGGGSAQTPTGSVTNFGIDDANVVPNSASADANVVANSASADADVIANHGEQNQASGVTGGSSSGTSDSNTTGITG